MEEETAIIKINPLHSFCIYSHHPSYSSMKSSPQAVVPTTLSYSNSYPKPTSHTPKLNSTILVSNIGHSWPLFLFETVSTSSPPLLAFPIPDSKASQNFHFLWFLFLFLVSGYQDALGSTLETFSHAFPVFFISSFYFIPFFPDTFYYWYVLMVFSNRRFTLLSLLFVFFFLRRGLPG